MKSFSHHRFTAVLFNVHLMSLLAVLCHLSLILHYWEFFYNTVEPSCSRCVPSCSFHTYQFVCVKVKFRVFEHSVFLCIHLFVATDCLESFTSKVTNYASTVTMHTAQSFAHSQET